MLLTEAPQSHTRTHKPLIPLYSRIQHRVLWLNKNCIKILLARPPRGFFSKSRVYRRVRYESQADTKKEGYGQRRRRGKAKRPPPVTLFNWRAPHNFRVARSDPPVDPVTCGRVRRGKKKNPWRLHSSGRNSVEFWDTACADMRGARNGSSGPALPQGSRICKGLLSHATQRALSPPGSLSLTSHTRRTFRRSANGRNTRAITCRYWSLIGAPGPSVDMPIIGLPRRQPTPVRLVSTRCYACAYRMGASAPLFHCERRGGFTGIKWNSTAF